MEFNVIFNWCIASLILVFAVLNVKTYLTIRQAIKVAKQQDLVLENNVLKAETKHQINSENLVILDGLHTSMLTRLFKITRDILLVQKTICHKYLK